MTPLPLSFIAEYEYCPRSAYWLLTDAPRHRDENEFIQDGRSAHKKVDEGYVRHKNATRIESSLRVFSEKYGISGKMDVAEFHAPTTERKQEIIPVEFKRGKVRENSMHTLQLALATICLKEMFPEVNITKGAIFFTGNRKRKEISITEELLQKAKSVAKTIHKKVENGMNPKYFPEEKDERCNGCCFHELCYLE